MSAPHNASLFTVSDTIGTGLDAHRTVSLGEFLFTCWSVVGDREPLASDEQVAKWLGIGQARNILGRAKKAFGADLPGIYCRTETMRQSTGNGGSREYQRDVLWFNKRQVYELMRRSKTPEANQFMDFVFSVLDGAAMRLQEHDLAAQFSAMHTAQMASVQSDVNVLREQLKGTRNEVEELRAAQDCGIISPRAAADMETALYTAASLRADHERDRKGIYQELLAKLRQDLDHTGVGCELSNLPKTSLAKAQKLVNVAKREAVKFRSKHPYPGMLFDVRERKPRARKASVSK